MSNLENTISSIRDILRSDGINNMDSVIHCLFFVLVRTLDKKMCKRLKLPKDITYKNLMKDVDDSQRLVERISANSKNSVKYLFVTILKMNIFKVLKIKSPNNLSSIMKKIKDLDIENLGKKYDIVGTIYELHLKTGANSARDLGQFFTHRKVIEYMVKLCHPKKDDTIYDPTMGTGGFLTMAVKYLNQKYSDINWSENKKNIFGCDIDENVKTMAFLNLLLETGENFDTLKCYDTLKNNTDIDKVNIILANEPMGLKGIKYNEVCSKIADREIKTTKGELLFLQLFMQTLKRDGRCAVIIPDGILFNDNKAYIASRTQLIKNFNLKKVISMNDKFFLNTGVKTSILFFENNGKTIETEFCEIKLENDKVVESVVAKVKYIKLKKENYSLFVNKYVANIEKKSFSVELKKIGDICKFKNGKQLSSSKFVEGDYFVIGGGQQPCGKHNEFNRNENTILCSSSGAYAGFISIYNTKIWASDCFSIHIKNKDDVENKYLYYYLKNNQDEIYKFQSGTAQPHVYSKNISEMQIPLPPLEIQKEIVSKIRILDKANKEMKKVMQKYEDIMKIYFETNVTLDIKKINFGSLVIRKSGKSLPKNKMINGEYPVIGGGATFGGCHNAFNYDDELLFIARVGTAGYISRYKGKCFVTDLVGAFKNDGKKILFDYMYNYLISIKDNIKNNYVVKTGAPSINLSKLMENLQIPVPPLEKQKEIVKYCNSVTRLIKKMENQIECNKQLIKDTLDFYLKSKDNDNE